MRNLRHHNFLRTNQFDVEHQLLGLEERFRVQHREALADALKQRLDALATLQTKWHPDILHFLLELADKPAQKTDLADLKLLKPPAEDIGPALKWEDIAKEDGWDQDPGIWRNVHFSDSSDDGYRTDATDESDGTSPSEVDSSLVRRPEDLIVSTDNADTLRAVLESQAWRQPAPSSDGSTRPRKVPVVEFQVIREVLFMLQGLETSLFSSQCLPDPSFQMAGVHWDTYKALITSSAESGRQLLSLRLYVRKPQSTPLLQVFHASVKTSLDSLDKKISEIQSRLVAPRMDTVVSLGNIQRELTPHLKPLHVLANIVRQVEETPNIGAFRYLELLYHEIGVAQSEDRMETYRFLGRIFFNCFQVYLRPIRLWMQEGQLLPGDRIFFVSDAAAQVPLHQIWEDRFKLRRTADGKLHVPSFLQPSVAQIFTAGKSIVVLKQLSKFESSCLKLNGPEPELTFEVVCGPGLEFAPFPELFGSAFAAWLRSKHSATSEALKRVLFDSCRLLANVEALERLYFMSDGSAATNLAQTLFNKMDSNRLDWQDRYLLTGLAQEAFSTVLDSHRVSAVMTGQGQQRAAGASVRNLLPLIGVKYRLDWPIQLVITADGLHRYQAVFTFLLQIRRGLSLLNGRRLLDEYSQEEDWLPERALSYRLRARMLWFCNCLQTYLTTVVLGPSMDKLRRGLGQAPDVDAMIGLHLDFTKQVINAACLGGKLEPIQESMLDVLDIALRLDRVENLQKTQEAEERQELSRLSVMSSPLRASPRRAKTKVIPREDSDDDDDDNDMAAARGTAAPTGQEKPYGDSLRELSVKFDRDLKFICEGLRGVARASSTDAASQWDLLAEMLESGVHGSERYP